MEIEGKSLPVYVELRVLKFINETFKHKESLRLFLINNDRLKVMVQNLQKEIRGSQFHILKEDIDTICDDFSRAFCKRALEFAEQASMTDLQKTIRQKELVDRQEFIDEFDEEDKSLEL